MLQKKVLISEELRSLKNALESKESETGAEKRNHISLQNLERLEMQEIEEEDKLVLSLLFTECCMLLLEYKP